MVQQVKTLVAMPCKLSLVPGSHMAEGEKLTLASCSLTATHASMYAHEYKTNKY